MTPHTPPALELPTAIPPGPVVNYHFTVLVVDDQRATRAALKGTLEHAGVATIIEAASAEEALEQFKAHRPDLVLLDIRLPGQDGYWAAQQIRAAEPGDWTPIIFLSGLDNELDVWRGIEVGGDDYLVKPVKPIVLTAKLRAMRRLIDMRRRLVSLSADLHEANQRLNTMVEIDSLTSIVNRRGFDRVLHQEIVTARRTGEPLTLILCDIDYFKLYNDHCGHLQGDACLRSVAQLLQSVCLRPRDLATRYGGEEFALILPNTPRAGAMTFARAVSQVLKAQGIAHPASPLGSYLSLSGGITTCVPDDNTHAENLLMRADQALYAAKAQGRNRFFSFEMKLDTIEQRSH